MTVGGSKVTKAYYNGQLVFDQSSTSTGVSGCIAFVGDDEFSVTKENCGNGTLEYSTDKTNWTSFSSSTTVHAVYSNSLKQYVVYYRGKSNTQLSGQSEAGGFALESSSSNLSYVKVIGDINCLLDYSVVAIGNTPQYDNYCFYCLFRDCYLITECEFTLPERTVPHYAYAYMFQGCDRLTKPPVIGAKTVGEYGMYSMFYGCTSLHSMDQDSFDIYSVNSYGLASMFYDSGLETAPAFTTSQLMLQESACEEMYSNCHSLITGVPEMHLYVIGNMCCYCMYNSCESLTTGTKLDIHADISGHAFQQMYMECSGLTDPGSIAQNNKSAGAYAFSQMYNYCDSLATLPDYTGVEFGESSCYGMFDYCSSLKQIYSFTSLGDGVRTVSDIINNGSVSDMYNGNTNIIIMQVSADECVNAFKFTTVAITDSQDMEYANYTIPAGETRYTNATIKFAG